MRDYTVTIARTFVFDTMVVADNAFDAMNEAEDLWSVPGAFGGNMIEELWTMDNHLKDGQIIPKHVVTEAVDVA